MAVDINKHFGNEVRKHRRKQNVSQLELSETSRVDLSTIGRIERGIANITLKNAFKVSKALHVPLYQFFLTDKKTRSAYRHGEIKDEAIERSL